MPIQHAVLALLETGPNYGYQLKASLEDTVGPQWGLNIGHIYQVLDRLRRDGLVSAAVVPAGKRPDRTMYSITTQGQSELEDWLSRPTVTTGYRDDMFLKLLAAARKDASTVLDLVNRQRQHHFGELKSLQALAEERALDPLVTLLVRSTMLKIQAQLSWLDEVDQNAQNLTTSTSQNFRPTLRKDRTDPEQVSHMNRQSS